VRNRSPSAPLGAEVGSSASRGPRVIPAALLVLVAATALAGCGAATPSASSSAAAPAESAKTTGGTPSLAEMLATIQSQSPVTATDPLVEAFARHLTSLRRKCGGSESYIAAEDDATHSLLKSRGVSYSLLQVAAGTDSSIPAGTPHPSGPRACSSFFSAFAVLALRGH
jgi:hypothetical protein